MFDPVQSYLSDLLLNVHISKYQCLMCLSRLQPVWKKQQLQSRTFPAVLHTSSLEERYTNTHMQTHKLCAFVEIKEV